MEVNGVAAALDLPARRWEAVVPAPAGTSTVSVVLRTTDGLRAPRQRLVRNQPLGWETVGMTIDDGGDLLLQDRYLGVGNGTSTLTRLDPMTGDATIISDGYRGTGPSLTQHPAGQGAPLALRASGSVLAVGPSASLIEVDLATGDRSDLGARSFITMDVDDQRGQLYGLVSTQERFGDPSVTEVFRVDLETGAGTFLSGPSQGTGPSLGRGGQLAFDPVGERVIVVAEEDEPSFPYVIRVIGIDLETGDRTELAGPDVGVGPWVAATRFGKDFQMAPNIAAGRVFVAAADLLIEVDLDTGARREVATGGPYWPGAYARGSVYALAPRASAAPIIAIDVATGTTRGVGSRGETHAAFPNFRGIEGVALARDAQDGAVYASRGLEVYRFEPDSGQLALVDDGREIPGQPTPSKETNMAFDERRRRLVRIDESLRGLLTIDPATGARAWLVEPEPSLGLVLSVVRDSLRDQLFVSHRNLVEALVQWRLGIVDPSNGSWTSQVITGPEGPSDDSYLLSTLDSRLFGVSSRPRRPVEIDPATGAHGLGIPFEEGDACATPPLASGAPAGSAYMLDRSDLATVNLATGAVALLPKPSGRRLDAFNPYEGMIVDEARRRAFAIHSYGYVIVFDLATGDRAVALR
ncbi:MAG: hypothetical protein AAF851_19955 [Myxococcota bacterium]